MNNLLRDLIEIGDVIMFINDVMVGIEMENGHNDIVEKILRRIVENDLFVNQKNMCKRLERLGF